MILYKHTIFVSEKLEALEYTTTAYNTKSIFVYNSKNTHANLSSDIKIR